MSEFEHKFRVELKTNEPRSRIDLLAVPIGEVWHIMKVMCLDKPFPDFELALYVNETLQTGISASTLCLGKETGFFSKIGLSGGCLAHFVATPRSTVTSPTTVGFLLKIQRNQSHGVSK